MNGKDYSLPVFQKIHNYGRPYYEAGSDEEAEARAEMHRIWDEEDAFVNQHFPTHEVVPVKMEIITPPATPDNTWLFDPIWTPVQYTAPRCRFYNYFSK